MKTLLLALLATSAHAGPAACPADTVAFDGYCMDRYEAPNVKGEKPFAFQTAQDGEKWCSDHGKKLCTEAQWVGACKGKAGRRFPYGDGGTYSKGTCNDDKTWRLVNWALLGRYPAPEAIKHAQDLYQGDASGSREDCHTPEGVYDLTGNVAEWVVRSFANGTNYGHVMKGCYWAGCFGGSAPDCSFANTAHPGNFRSYESGFRCCSDRD